MRAGALTRLRLNFGNDWIIVNYVEDEGPVWRAEHATALVIEAGTADRLRELLSQIAAAWQESFEARMDP